jgi:hypothetical protein
VTRRPKLGERLDAWLARWPLWVTVPAALVLALLWGCVCFVVAALAIEAIARVWS